MVYYPCFVFFFFFFFFFFFWLLRSVFSGKHHNKSYLRESRFLTRKRMRLLRQAVARALASACIVKPASLLTIAGSFTISLRRCSSPYDCSRVLCEWALLEFCDYLLVVALLALVEELGVQALLKIEPHGVHKAFRRCIWVLFKEK
eukprot:TRINITY_DN2056_c0_g1_i2.p1 TRINITY_DN2056_c0_g1~~TRINITY_DN2056_c0_g1_i2.p1  ORF type:complete len:146 (-),score=43.80 TRINITY_DN2056_c0_g1_i2:242-679(-)